MQKEKKIWNQKHLIWVFLDCNLLPYLKSAVSNFYPKEKNCKIETKCLCWVFLSWNLKNLCRIWRQRSWIFQIFKKFCAKQKTSNLEPEKSCSGLFSQEFERNIITIIWNQQTRVFQNATFSAKQKTSNLGPNMSYL